MQQDERISKRNIEQKKQYIEFIWHKNSENIC